MVQLNLILGVIFGRIFQLQLNLYRIYNHHLILVDINMKSNFILFWLNDDSEDLINFTFFQIILLYIQINPKNNHYVNWEWERKSNFTLGIKLYKIE